MSAATIIAIFLGVIILIIGAVLVILIGYVLKQRKHKDLRVGSNHPSAM